MATIPNKQMTNYNFLLDMTVLMAGGWLISLQDIEVLARIVSLVVPTVLSVLLFIRNIKRNGKKEKK
jgi:hypothetical protein